MIRNPLANEKGVALLVALGAFVIISILGAASLTVASGSINQTIWDRSSNQAFNLAEGGFNWAVAKARQETLSAGTYTVKLTNGEASVTVEQLNPYLFNVKSVGAQPSLAAPKARRAVEGKITALNPYGVMLATSAGGTWLGSTKVYGPLYVYDLLQLEGNGAVFTGPLFIKNNPKTADKTGDLVMIGNSSSVGTASEPIYAFIDGAYPSNNSNLHTVAIYSDVPELDMPVITSSEADMVAQRARADLVIDTAADKADLSIPPNGNFQNRAPDLGLIIDKDTADQTYGSYPGGPYLKWTKATKTLEIKGTVFVDGLVTIGNSAGGALANQIIYEGKGTIIANGDIQFYSRFLTSPGSDFPAQSGIGFITGYEATINTKNDDHVYALIYAYTRITFTNKTFFRGGLMTKETRMLDNPTISMEPQIYLNIPPGMPEVQTSTSVTGWREVKP
jgi:Tfp pilus assembly protein PilX